ncbi:hypothetical protein [Rubrivivax rivuli]|uniref:Uncharacterized protein n=1 Tax=Rubrivivax rivuli TaxID=1862385 RepID=A0A437RGS8_9BURK|nr:hypothetical protein [Rubrivivax rivuli]RVU45959.1 hypothetical protein EOE66_08760 [Rubrivivax rivuli]
MPTQPASRPVRRPSSGRPKPLALCSVFLLTPEADAKLDGISLRAALKADGREYLFKIFERVMRCQPGQSQRQLIVQLDALYPKGREVPPLLDLIRRAIYGDPVAISEAESVGLWQCWKAGLGERVPFHQRIAMDHAIEVEQACLAILADLRDKSFDRVAAAIAFDQRLRPYATDTALGCLTSATSEVTALPARVACLCEFLLSQVARVDVAMQLRRGEKGSQSFSYLVGTDDGKRCTPGGNLIRWIQTRFGVVTLEGLLALNAKGQAPAVIDESTLKRWSSDAVFPSGTKLGQLVLSVLKSRYDVGGVVQAELTVIGAHYWAARRLHKVLQIARRLHAIDRSADERIRWMQLMNDTTPETWCRRRYPLWIAHWQERDEVASGT